MEKCTHSWYYYLLLIIVVIGGINWGLVGFFQYDLVQTITGGANMAARVVYDVVGVASVLLLLATLMQCGRGK